MRIEVFYSPYCRGCGGPEPGTGARTDVAWKNVTEHLEEAVRLGVTRPPALVVDGRLIVQGTEALAQLDRLLTRTEN